MVSGKAVKAGRNFWQRKRDLLLPNTVLFVWKGTFSQQQCGKKYVFNSVLKRCFNVVL